MECNLAQPWYILFYEANNKRSSIVKDILHIHFTNLIALALTKNNIHSIEELSEIKMPQLQTLFISRITITKDENKII